MVFIVKVKRVEQHNIKLNTEFGKLIDEYCLKSKNLYNYANYIVRQEFINNNKWIRYNELFDTVKDSEPYKDIGSNTGQATLRMLDSTWKSFFEGMKEWKKNPSKYFGMPQLPKYKKKDGRFILSLDSNKVKLIDGYVYFSWKPFKKFNNLFKTNAKERILQCRFVPKRSHYVMEIVYEIEPSNHTKNPERIASIDLGVDNFVTMVNNIGITPIIIKGGIIKSINQYYNKHLSRLQKELKNINDMIWSKKMQSLTDKRHEKIKYQMHCVSKYIIDWCSTNDIGSLIIGHNNKWKDGKKHMQNFTYIPYNLFIDMVKYKGENAGIDVIVVDEAYTSGTSFIDKEGPNKDSYDKSRRIHRGLFVSNSGKEINADVNAAYQIMKKVFPNVFPDGIEGVGLHPMTIKHIA